MSAWGIVTLPGALPDADPLGVRRRQVEQRLDRQPVVHDDVGPAQHLVAAHGEQARIARPGADEEDGHPPEPTSVPRVQDRQAARRRRAPRGRGAGTAPRSRGARATRRIASPSARCSRHVERAATVPPSRARRGRARPARSVAATIVAQLGRPWRWWRTRRSRSRSLARPQTDVAEPELGHPAAVDDQSGATAFVCVTERPIVHPLVAEPLARPRAAARTRAGRSAARSSGVSSIRVRSRLAPLEPPRCRSSRPGPTPSRGPCVCPSGDARNARSERSSPSTTAYAPAGSEQSPPSSARKARSASTQRRVGACSMRGEHARAGPRRPSRHSTASAAWPTCGSTVSASSRSVMCSRQPEAVEGGGGHDDRVVLGGLGEAGLHVAAQAHEAEVGTVAPAAPPAGAASRWPPPRPAGRSARVDPTSASRGSPRSGTAASTRPGTVTDGRSLALCTARSARPSSTAACTSLANTPLPPSS